MIEQVSGVRVTDPVDGSGQAQRKSPSRASHTNRPRSQQTTLNLDDVHPEVAAAVQRVRRPGERITIVSPIEVRLHA